MSKLLKKWNYFVNSLKKPYEFYSEDYFNDLQVRLDIEKEKNKYSDEELLILENIDLEFEELTKKNDNLLENINSKLEKKLFSRIPKVLDKSILDDW